MTWMSFTHLFLSIYLVGCIRHRLSKKDNFPNNINNISKYVKSVWLTLLQTLCTYTNFMNEFHIPFFCQYIWLDYGIRHRFRKKHNFPNNINNISKYVKSVWLTFLLPHFIFRLNMIYIHYIKKSFPIAFTCKCSSIVSSFIYELICLLFLKFRLTI